LVFGGFKLFKYFEKYLYLLIRIYKIGRWGILGVEGKGLGFLGNIVFMLDCHRLD
jgi:hypothetical protein